MIAKIISGLQLTRDEAIQAMSSSLKRPKLQALKPIEYLQNIIACDVFHEGTQTTRFLNTLNGKPKNRSAASGIQTSVQDVTGRLVWDVGVPPSVCY
jgi:urea carboxylase